MIVNATGGDPMGSPKWSRRTPEKIAQQLDRFGLQVSATTVARLLTKMMGYSLRVNHKKVESGVRNPPDPQAQDQQFHYIDQQRAAFVRRGEPIISIDTKKKELIGNFKNNGRAWKKEAVRVNDHDYPSDAEGRMVPCGIYDPQANEGLVCVGDSADTPAFAVDSIERWWREVGDPRYPQATDLLILADGGPANGSRSRLWHYQLQRQLCDPYGLTVTVCHFPPGASKWNPIEHRLFSEISKNWAGEPLVSFRTALHFIRTTEHLRQGHKKRKKRYGKPDGRGQIRDRVSIEQRPGHDRLPDLILYRRSMNIIYPIEIVTSVGPFSKSRKEEVRAILSKCGPIRYGVVCISTFPDRTVLRRFIADIAWETKIWIAAEHYGIIHFDMIQKAL